MASADAQKGANQAPPSPDLVQKPASSGFFTEERLLSIAQAAFISALGGAFAYGGFQFGLRRQIEKAKTEFETDKRIAEVDPNKVGPSGVPAKNLVMRAFIRGSAVALVIAGMAGIGLSFAVEAKHKGVSKEQEEREMQELYKVFGLDKSGRPLDEPPADTSSKNEMEKR